MDALTLESLILNEIRKSHEISRRDLSDRLEIARSTAGRRVDSMIERGMIREKGIESRDSVGRPRRFLELCGEYGGFIGIDFDARNIYGAVLDFSQKVVERQIVPLPINPDANLVLRKIRSLGQKLEDRVDPLRILGTGLAVPGRVDRTRRIGISYPNISGWENVLLTNGLHLSQDRLFIENSTRASGLGEYWFGQRAGEDNLVCLKVRTDISASAIANGSLVVGSNELAGEIRAWPAMSHQDSSGNPVWIEKVATIQAITDSGEHAHGTDKEIWRRFVNSCTDGDSDALSKLEELAGYHGMVLSQIIQLVDPGAIVVSGWFARIGDAYLSRLREAVIKSLEGHYFDVPEINLSKLDEFSGAMGAATLAARQTGSV